MKPPPTVVDAVARVAGCVVVDARPVGGGCISPAWRVSCSDGSALFLKTAPPDAPAWMLTSEAESLRMLDATATVLVPKVRAVSEGWLALEWLQPAAATAAGWSELGARLARLHRNIAARFGRDTPNCIGRLPQSNDWLTDWPAFWRERRLRPQRDLAASHFDSDDMAELDRLLDHLDVLLEPGNEDGPSLLHGDLWSGNVHFTTAGGALIDPSSHYGHREVDLAMAALFGGFPAPFFDAYVAEWPLLPGAAGRRPIYQLYYLLVHVNLFGGSYVDQTRAALRASVRELSRRARR